MKTAARTRIISHHAIERWQERVERGAGSADARRAIREFLAAGRVRPTPRHWTTAAPTPGLCFVYWASRPSVCALVRENVVVTVLTRPLCRASRGSPVEPLMFSEVAGQPYVVSEHAA